MPDNKARISVHVPLQLAEAMDKAIAQGKYVSRADYVRTAIRALEQNSSERDDIIAGLQDMIAGRVQPIEEACDDIIKDLSL